MSPAESQSDTGRMGSDGRSDTIQTEFSPLQERRSDTLTRNSHYRDTLHPIRPRYEVQTRVGVQSVPGSLQDGLLIHRTIAAPGCWTVTHCRSGQSLVTRLPNRGAVLLARTTLLSMPGTTWSAADPFLDAQTKATVFAYVQTLPRWHSRKPLRNMDPTPMSSIPTCAVVAAWSRRAAGLDGQHDQPVIFRTSRTPSRVQQRRLDYLSKLIVRTFPPIPVGSLVAYYRHGRLRGGCDEPNEGHVVKARWKRAEKSWWFYLSNGLIVDTAQIAGVSLMHPVLT